ncbi:MAG: Rieske (2Fe-2S) protein [Acidobacteria bacterium]|nr:Rieske (2Fe-2S) protein [Acidobacteriota bacterium]
MHQISVPLNTLKLDQPNIIKQQGKQLCAWHKADRWFVFDLRCPHEGYPLAQGELQESCILTCHWHNWKFDLRTGENLDDYDRLRVYDHRIENEWFLIEWQDETPEQIRARLEPQLKGALRDRDYGRLHRLVAQYHYTGLGAADALRFAVKTYATRFQYGTTHAFGAATDWMILSDAQQELELQLAPYAEILDHISLDGIKGTDYPFPDGELPFDEGRMIQAINDEKEADAIAMARTGQRDQVLDALRKAALEHYRDFGHSLIFVEKTEALAKRLGPDVWEPLVFALIRGLCTSFKEDLIPEFKGYRDTVEALAGLTMDGKINLEPMVGRSTPRIFDWLVAHREAGAHVLFDALVQAAARQMWAFNEAIYGEVHIPIQKNIGWLDFTHALTFAEAGWQTCQRFPELWAPVLTQLACFIGRNATFVKRDQLQVKAVDVDLSGVALIDHGMAEPIFACHRIKTYYAVQNLKGNVSLETHKTLRMALHRYLTHTYPHRFVRRTAYQMTQLVARDYPQRNEVEGEPVVQA